MYRFFLFFVGCTTLHARPIDGNSDIDTGIAGGIAGDVCFGIGRCACTLWA